MPYLRYSEQVENLESLLFVRTDNLQDTLSDLKHIAFSYQTQRTQGLQILADMVLQQGDEYFDEMKQFPKKIKLICVQLADWPMKFEQLRSSLNYKVPDVAATNKNLTTNTSNFQTNDTSNRKLNNSDGDNGKDDASKTITNMNEREKFEKALKSFTTAIADIESQIHGSTLSQRNFERKYNLEWTDKSS